MSLRLLVLFFTSGTVRRFLEHFSEGIDLVVFVSDEDDVCFFYPLLVFTFVLCSQFIEQCFLFISLVRQKRRSFP